MHLTTFDAILKGLSDNAIRQPFLGGDIFCFKIETSVWGLRECPVLRSVWALIGFPGAVE